MYESYDCMNSCQNLFQPSSELNSESCFGCNIRHLLGVGRVVAYDWILWRHPNAANPDTDTCTLFLANVQFTNASSYAGRSVGWDRLRHQPSGDSDGELGSVHENHCWPSRE